MLISKVNPLRNTHIEFHILQSFPVTCLNRDDVGAPKTAVVGGVTRARVSSQCWKRQVRLALREFNAVIGSRTKLIAKLVATQCLIEGATTHQAESCGSKIEQIFIKKSEKKPKKGKEGKESEELENAEESEKDKTDTLLFLSPNEVSILAKAFAANGFDPNLVIKEKDAKKQAKELAKLIGEANESINALDIALFGRMVAQAADMNVEAAASFSHAISTHKVGNEVEFFTALDDEQEEPGSAHMGSLEFNSATYYRYVSLDLGQLWQTLSGHNIPEAVEAFTKALFVAVPSARQTTQSGACPWEYAKVFVRKGQRLQVPFETPIKTKEGGFLKGSLEAMNLYLAKQEKLHGSLFGKKEEYAYGEDESVTIDLLVAGLRKHAEVDHA